MDHRETATWMRDSETDFLAFASAALPHSWSQRLQDLWALWESGFARRGYFIEFGALNGRDFSNTYLLEQLGWAGIVAEPHPDYHKIVRENRSCNVSTKCVFSESGKILAFNAVNGRPALSSISGFGGDDDRKELRANHVTHEVETISLKDLLDQYAAPDTIDFMSVDTEGSELVILRSFDFKSYFIKAICVEHNEHQRDKLFDLLTGNGYVRKWERISGHDDWYVHIDTRSDAWNPAESRNPFYTLGSCAQFERALAERITLLQDLTRSAG